MSGCGCEMTARNDAERKTLWMVLSINALMFVIEFGFGLWAQSTGLIADSLDMLADASVYGIGLYAVGKSAGLKIKSARASGVVQIILALWVLFEVLRKVLYGSEPMSSLMMAVGLIALVAHWICLTQIANHQDDGVHMRASYIFSKNDVIANLGVIVAGVLVGLTGTRYPDLVIGLIIAALVLRGGLSILREAKEEEMQVSAQSTQFAAAATCSRAMTKQSDAPTTCCSESTPTPKAETTSTCSGATCCGSKGACSD